MRRDRRNRYIFHVKRFAVRMSYYLGRRIQGYPAINKYTEFSTVWTLPKKADEQIIKYCEFDSSLMLPPINTNSSCRIHSPNSSYRQSIILFVFQLLVWLWRLHFHLSYSATAILKTNFLWFMETHCYIGEVKIF